MSLVIFLTCRQSHLKKKKSFLYSFESLKKVYGGEFDSALTTHYLNEPLSSELTQTLFGIK